VKKGGNNPFSHLKNLKRLWLNGFGIGKNSDLTSLSLLNGLTGLNLLDVSHTRVHNLTPLSNLSCLEFLDISNTQVNDLSPLLRLRSLRKLYASQSKVNDLSPLAGLIGLQELDLQGTLVSDLTPLANLLELEWIDLSLTRIINLVPLSYLTGLQWLDISFTSATDLSPLLTLIRQGLSVEWGSDFVEGNGICVKDCPISVPPIEIVQQGNDAILNYLNEREIQGMVRVYEAKLLIVGEGGAGKTSLLRRLYQTKKDLPRV
jgi:internalin A